MRLAVILAAVVALGGTGGSAPPKLVGSRPCPEATGFTCSTLTVPLDRSGAGPGTLSLRVAVADAPSSGPYLVFLTGGPGQPGIPSAARVAQKLGRAVGRYRLVMLDQRGTGAGALRCPALQAQMGASDLTAPSAKAVDTCAAAIGAKRRFFTTAHTVEDVDALRTALGAKKIALDGVSYGTFVAERYALAHPARVDRLVLDSVVPHAGVDPFVRASLQASARVLGRAAASDLAAIVAKRGNGVALLDTLVILSIVDPNDRGLAPALHEARAGRTGALDRFVTAVSYGKAAGAEALSQGLHASALCGDMPDAALPPAKRIAALRRAAARLTRAEVWPFDRRTAAGNGIAVTCSRWPATPGGPVRVARNLPPVPVLLLAGDRDLSTPLAWARQEAARAPRGKLVVVPGAGHSVQTRGGAAARAALAAFLR